VASVKAVAIGWPDTWASQEGQTPGVIPVVIESSGAFGMDTITL
jgi:hypothetical protein